MITIELTILDKTPHFRLGYLELEDVIVQKSPEEFWEKFDREMSGIKDHFKDKPLTDDPRIQGMRRLFKTWKIDPARYRPSAERLHRRILKGEDLYRINTAVDVCNMISLRYRLPLGLYDKDKARGALILRYGREGEHYLGITDIEIGAEQKVVVCDDTGPVGSAVSDSQRTAIDETTTALILLVYGPENVGKNYIEDVLHDYSNTLSSLQDSPTRQTIATIIDNKSNKG